MGRTRGKTPNAIKNGLDSFFKEVRVFQSLWWGSWPGQSGVLAGSWGGGRVPARRVQELWPHERLPKKTEH